MEHKSIKPFRQEGDGDQPRHPRHGHAEEAKAEQVPAQAEDGGEEGVKPGEEGLSKQEKERRREVESWLHRRGAGSTNYQGRLDHRVRDFRLDASQYHEAPSIIDFPIQAINPSCHKPNPRVFIDLVSFRVSVGKLIIELFQNEVPRTCDNFRSLCLGDNAKKLSYAGCRFHKIIPGFIMVAGDIHKGDGSGGESIYDEDFPDESFQLGHVGAGILSMVNRGVEDSNHSQFCILLNSAEWLNGRQVVFGKVVEGIDLIHKVGEKFGTKDGIPSADIYIGTCGLMK